MLPRGSLPIIIPARKEYVRKRVLRSRRVSKHEHYEGKSISLQPARFRMQKGPLANSHFLGVMYP